VPEEIPVKISKARQMQSDITKNMVQNTSPERISLKVPRYDRSHPEPNETWLQLALDSAQMCAYKWDLKTDRIIRSARSAPGSMVEPDRSSFIYSEDRLLIHPDDREMVDDRIREAVEFHRDFDIEYRVTPKNSPMRWIQSRGHVVYDDHDEAVEILAVTQDITRKKEDELRLKNQTMELEIAKEKLNLALHSAGMVAVVVAGGGPGVSIRSAELCRLWGIEDENTEININVVTPRIHPDDLKRFLAEVKKNHEHGEKIEHDYRIHLPNGEIRWFATKGAALRKGRGESLTRYVVIQDVTKIKESEDQIRQKNDDLSVLNEKLDRFSSMVAHDLKGPLSTISMAADMIDRADSMNEMRKSAKFIKSGVSRMATFISDLLEFAKTEHEALLPKETVSLHETIETVKSNLKAAIAESHAQIEIQSPLPKVSGHPTQLLQLFQNLISNSLKFRSRRTPQVTLSVKDDSDHWLVTLKDNGEGIDPNKSQIIFEPFQRLHSGRVEGAGLGLSICKKIVELHGGKIWLESQPGFGSEFSFTLSKI
jgi:signal transduction histidine kinase